MAKLSYVSACIMQVLFECYRLADDVLHKLLHKSTPKQPSRGIMIQWSNTPGVVNKSLELFEN